MKAKPKATAAMMVFLPAALIVVFCVAYWDVFARVAIVAFMMVVYALIWLMAAMGLLH